MITSVIGSLSAGQSAAVTILVRPSQSVGATPGLPITASVAGNAFDPHPSDNSAGTSVAVLPSDDLAVALLPAQASGEVGTTLTLFASISNLGPAPATGVVLSLPLANGSQVRSVTAPGGLPAGQPFVQPGLMVVPLGSLAAGASAQLSIVLVPMASGQDSWTATVAGNEFDLDLTSNQATATVAVAQSPGVLQFASPMTTVNETAGVAAISVVRTVGALGPVTVSYQTLSGPAATPGLDYTPIAGTLLLANGQTSGTILVPVLNNPYDNHDEYVVLAISSPTGGAVLGAATTTILRIHDTDPDFTPPLVTNVQWSGSSTVITSLTISFSKPLQPGSATNPADYQVCDMGTSGLANAPGSWQLGLAPPAYNAASDTVTLTPQSPMLAGHFYQIAVAGTGAAPVRDLAGNPLAGAMPAWLVRTTWYSSAWARR